MTRRDEEEAIREQLESEAEMFDEDLELLRHVMLEDESPPQGLHRQGWKEPDQS